MNERRVLIVDDSLTIRRLAERALRQEGFVTEAAESIGEALVRVPLFQPDVVLLDYVLPDGYGTDACRSLLASPATASIPVVLISAKGGDIRQLYIDLPNVVDFVTKPFTPAVLVSMVAHVLHSSRPAGQRRTADAPERSGQADGAGDGSQPVPVDASLLLAGRTRLLPLDRVLDALQRDGGVSRLQVSSAPGAPAYLTVWLEAGRVAWARPIRGSLKSRVVRERLAAVSPDVLEAAARAESQDGLSAVSWLSRNGHLTPAEAVALAREVATDALLECMDADDLAFTVVSFPDLPAEVEALQAALSTDEVRMARLRRADAWHVIEEAIPSLEVVLIRTAEASRQAARVGLLPAEEEILSLVDGTRPVRDLVSLVGGTAFDVCRVLYRLVEAGLARIKQRRGEPSASRIRRVLVVDSDPERVYPAVVEALTEVAVGIEVRGHRELLSRVPWAIRVFQPDALLLDVRLEGLDVLKLVKLLRQSAEFHSMLIVATGESLWEEEVRHLLRVGFSHVLPKPFLVDELCELVGGEHEAPAAPRASVS